ncbi:uncharacterized protein J8A68_002198 [[Candida] subhashii]|uniref:Uncharacterized protein n=1 Tax=[Candida] subhashii TaxID=561895 RepID=A0A8J5QPY2_9ASCO|nr:uncharacterized protein J8A68_002198 [[Candida] subhashii]KAG7664283.1 hypothetical protein J8A68_002198 [[Candida] subhashii]
MSTILSAASSVPHPTSDNATPSSPINIKKNARSASPSDDTHPEMRSSPYSRRVSFNNLHPDDDSNVPPNQAIYNLGSPNFTPSYSLYSAPQTLGSASHSSQVPSFESTFGTLVTKANTYIPRKRLKLPDPPSKSILKNKVSEQQLEYNEKNDLLQDEGNIEDATTHYHDEEEILAGPDLPPPPPTGITETPRRKSYAGMTDEELLALDPQFQTKSIHDLDKFKFDNQKTYYLSPSTRKPSSTPSLLSQPTSKKIIYPTSNENNYRSISLTVKHDEFDTIPYNRTLLTVLTGRKHTWNTIDWLLLIEQDKPEESSFLIDGDYLIIASLIPNKFIKDYTNRRKKVSIYDFLHKKCTNLLNYAVEYSAKLNLKLKITVEFVLDNSEESALSTVKVIYGEKYMLQNVFRQYQPNIIIVGNKSSNLNFKYPIKMAPNHQQYMIKLSSYILKYSTIPVIFVGNDILSRPDAKQPSTSTLKFEPSPPPPANAAPKILLSSATPSSSVNAELTQPSTSTPQSLSSSPSRSSLDSSIESFSPESEEDLTKRLTASSEELRRHTYNKQLGEIHARDFSDPQKFLDLIITISDNSFIESSNYLTALNSKDYANIKFDEKIHSIYRSQTTPGAIHTSNDDAHHYDTHHGGAPIYKVRSMISYDDDEEVKNAKLRKDLKKRRASDKGSGGGGSNSGSSSGINSTKSNESSIGSGKSNSEKKKKSFWKKLGFKKK